jgi:hypothetical protein
MTNIRTIGTAAQSPPLTANRVADFGDAIRNACVALKSGSIDGAITSLEKASRRAGEVGDPRATELANFANALAPALETVGPGATVGVGSLLVGQVTQAHRDQLPSASEEEMPSGRSRRRYGADVAFFTNNQATRQANDRPQWTSRSFRTLAPLEC